MNFESGREPGLKSFFLGIPLAVVLEAVERVLVATERTEAAEE